VCTRRGEAIVLDRVVRDGPSRDDAQLLRKSDLLVEELGMPIRMTVARPIDSPRPPVEAASGGAVIALRAPQR
jgi:hypothetical protein